MKASTVMEVFIEEDTVRVEQEIGGSDLEGFKNLLPNELLDKMDIEVLPITERLPRFFMEDLTIRLDDGPPLPGFVEAMEGRWRVKRDEITGEPLPVAEVEGEKVFFVKLVYPFQNRPKTFAIKPPMQTGRHFAGANIGFMTYHLGLPIMDFRYLGREETADLDWEDPWYSKFRNRNLWRQYNSPINLFLYVEPYEIRVEVIARPKDLQQWVDLGVGDHDTLPIEIQPGLREKVGDFLGQHMRLNIDGRNVSPTLDRIHFLKRTLRVSTVIEPAEELDIASATLGAIFIYRTSGLPHQAALTWDLFSTKLPMVRAAAIDEAGPMPYFLTPDDNQLKWKNFLKNPTTPMLVDVDPLNVWTPLSVPIASVLCGLLVVLMTVRVVRSRRFALIVPASLLILVALVAWPHFRVTMANPLTRFNSFSDKEKNELIGALLTNIYVSFDFRDESAIYDALARSATGELLTRIYLEMRRSLELQNQGGARVKIKEVDLIEVDHEKLTGKIGFVAKCTWNVRGTVGHWGHLHQRTNQYVARITVKSLNNEWKIVDLELLEEKRIS